VVDHCFSFSSEINCFSREVNCFSREVNCFSWEVNCFFREVNCFLFITQVYCFFLFFHTGCTHGTHGIGTFQGKVCANHCNDAIAQVNCCFCFTFLLIQSSGGSLFFSFSTVFFLAPAAGRIWGCAC